MTLTLLKFYFAINVLLIFAYLLFKATRYLTEFAKVPISYLSLNRIAQLLVVTAISAPMVFALLPQESVPNLKFNIRAPIADLPSSKTITKTFRLEPTSHAQHKAVSRPKAAPLTIDIGLCALIILGLGLITALSVFVVRLLKLRTLLRDSILIRKIGRVRIFVSDFVTIPFSTLIGGGANVVVPTNVISDTRNLRIIIQHELHHHRNGDTVWILMMEVSTCLFYLNPFAHYWKREIAEVQEFACDEALIGQMRVSAHDYGQCLVKIAEATRGISSMQVGTTCMGASPKGPQQLKSFLRRRIEVFKDHKSTQKKRLLGIALGTIGIFVTAGLAYGAQKSLRAEVSRKPNIGIAKFDPAAQKATEDILKKYVKKFGAKGGFVLVADSQTGRLLAVANQLSTKNKMGTSWALSYEIEPASVMKGIIAASALERKVLRVDEKLNCENGKYNYGGRVYRDWKPFGTVTTTESIRDSSNICGIKIGERLGASGLESSLKDFGFGPDGTASEFPEAMPGHYPKASDLAESDYVPLISVGYTDASGFYVTPLEVLQAYGAIANDGKLMKPLMVSAESSAGTVLKQTVSPETAQKMKSILVDVVKNGTGKNAQSSLYTTAGKTSTAYRPESPEHDSLGGERAMAGFVGFAPAQNPRLVVYVGVFDPTNSKDKNPHGSEHAAPVFKEVVEAVLQQMKVAPDNKLTM